MKAWLLLFLFPRQVLFVGTDAWCASVAWATPWVIGVFPGMRRVLWLYGGLGDDIVRGMGWRVVWQQEFNMA